MLTARIRPLRLGRGSLRALLSTVGTGLVLTLAIAWTDAHLGAATRVSCLGLKAEQCGPNWMRLAGHLGHREFWWVPDISRPVPDSEGTGETGRDIEVTPANEDARVGAARTPVAIPWSSLAIEFRGRQRLSREATPRCPVASVRGSDPGAAFVVVRHESGWPWRALEWTGVIGNGAEGTVHATPEACRGIPLAPIAGDGHPWLQQRSLPLSLNRVGFVLDVCFWSLVAAVVMVPLFVTRGLRRYLQRCECCGYRRAGLSSSACCPECGQASSRTNEPRTMQV